MSGRSCGRSAGARNGPSAKRGSATKRPSATGSARGGRPLKKSPKTRPHDRLHRRKRIESEAASLPHLGAARRDAAAGVQLQLAEAFGVGRVDVAQLLLSPYALYPGAIGELEVIDFLKALVRHIDTRTHAEYFRSIQGPAGENRRDIHRSRSKKFPRISAADTHAGERGIRRFIFWTVHPAART